MKDPSKVYQRLFKTSNSNKDITDLILEDASNFKKNLSYHDKDKLDEYFDSVREIETQIEKLNEYYRKRKRADVLELSLIHI